MKSKSIRALAPVLGALDLAACRPFGAPYIPLSRPSGAPDRSALRPCRARGAARCRPPSLSRFRSLSSSRFLPARACFASSCTLRVKRRALIKSQSVSRSSTNAHLDIYPPCPRLLRSQMLRSSPVVQHQLSRHPILPSHQPRLSGDHSTSLTQLV